MTIIYFRKQLKKLARAPIEPDPAWVAKTRAIILEQTRNTVATEPEPRSFTQLLRLLERLGSLFLPRRLAAAGRTIGVFLLVGLATVGGWIANVSAAESLPGDAMYKVKIVQEKTELLVASIIGGEAKKVTTLLKHASRRVEEYQKSHTPTQASQAIKSLKSSIANAQEELESASDNQAAVAVARVVTEKTDELLTSLRKGSVQSGDAALSASASATSSFSTSAAPVSATAEQTLLQKEVGEASHLITVTAVNAVEVMVEKKLEGSTQINIEEVKANVEKKVDQLVAGVSSISKDVATASALVSSSTSALSEPATTTPVSILTFSASAQATSPAGQAMAAGAATTRVIKEQLKATGEKADAAAKAAEKTAAEAKTLIENNDLLAALKKVETLVEVKKDIVSAVIDARMAAGETAAPANPAEPSSRR